VYCVVLRILPAMVLSVFIFVTAGAICDDAFLIGSTCYKIHKERVRWFTAVNRCLSNNATLAVFDDNVRRNIPIYVASDAPWIGLIKSWWTWPGLNIVL